MYKYFAKTFHIVKIVVVVLLCVRMFIIEPGTVNGRSMEHTYLDDDFFLVNKLILFFREPKRGDVIVLHDPIAEKQLIKRVIGVPGDRLYIDKTGVYLQDNKRQRVKIEEPYLDEGIITRSPSGKAETYTVIQPNKYFVMGDNRSMSIDSRNFGAVHRKLIYGTVIEIPFFKK